jgi:hypothetical protein
MTTPTNWNPTAEPIKYVHASGSIVITHDGTGFYRNPMHGWQPLVFDRSGIRTLLKPDKHSLAANWDFPDNVAHAREG